MTAGGEPGLVLLADESVVHPIVICLRQAGFALQAVEDLAPSVDDDVVLQTAATLGALLLTEDKDFGDLVYQRHLPWAGEWSYLAWKACRAARSAPEHETCFEIKAAT